MDQFKKDISSPRLGINRSTDVRNLKGNDTTYVLNGNIESVDGDFIDYAFEKSNVLSVTFPEGYRVIGRVNRLSNNKTYYFLTNPNTGNSMFGFVDNNKQFDESDLEDNEGELPAPLEEQVQVAYNNFQILIDDSCTENGFNFNINYPIHNPLIKEEKTGGEIYFTDFRNPSRYIELDNIERYFIREVPCSEDEEVQCADFEKMRIHKRYKLPKISDVSVANGGALKKGSYTFVIALCDLQGNEISEYTSLTQPVSIWDKDDNTGQAIKLTVTDLDEDYNHYKIVAMTPSPVEVGVYSTANKEITISDLTQSKRTSLESISYVNTKVLRSEGLTVIQNSLAEYGLVFEEEMNLQPVVNLMGSFLQWQTHVATEDLYRHGDMRSKFLGFNRNEVVPYSIRFLIDGGTTTALFPLVGREATAIDREQIPLSNLDRKSFDNPTLCNQSLREERWQYYNTATVTGGCESELEGVEVTDTYTEVCTSFNTGSTGEGSLMFGTEETVYTLEDYIEDNINGCQGKLQDTNICDVLNQDYNAQCDVTFNSECSQPEKVSEVNFISEIIGESVKDVYGSGKPFENIITDPNTIPPILNQTFADGLSYENGAVKFSNRSASLVNPFDGSRPSTALNMQLGTNMSVGRTAKSSNTSWNTTIYIGEEKSKQVNVQGHGTHTLNWGAHLIEPHFYKTTIEEPVALHVLMDKRPDRDTEGNLKENPEEFIKDDTIRVTLYNGVGIDQNPQNLIKSYLTSELEGKVIICTPENGTLKVQVTTIEGSVVDEAILENFNTGTQLLIGVDFPTVNMPHLGPMATVNISPRASFFLYKEKVEKVGTLVSWEDIKVSTTISYKSTCTYIEPVIKSCETSKYEKGEFSYWESERLYPDNSELYDSSRLKIKGADIPAPYRNLFSSKFSNGSSGSSTYKVKNSYNLTCKPIRHFKFPDNKISPFMTHSRVSEFGESYIYPLGVTVDENCINLLLDVAEYNGLITKGQRDSIYGYEIFRGNLTVDRTVVSSGLLYDMREYEEAGRNVKYPNYPYNSYSEDKLNLESIKSNSFGKRGSLFTFSSPETDYTGNNKGTEINIQGYQFGYSKGWFDEVQDHPKMVILSNRAYNTAEDLATTEVIAESLITLNEGITNVGPLWFVAGVGSSGTNTGGYVAGMAAAVIASAVVLAEGYLHRYATYKYQWLETFKNLGSQTNFASYYFSEGNYNYLLPLQTEGNKVRNIRFNKKLKEGRYVITDTVNKEKTEINNIDREQSVAIKVDDIIYPNEYSNYDNESLTYLGENGVEFTGRSPQINKRIASPYIQVVNNNPSVHGDIDSVQWISTSYRGDLRNPRVDCLPIFGGDTFISRHTLKRKMPLFLSTLMGQANMTPFDYKFYNNIGKEPRFYVNFDVNSEFVSKGKMFPELRSEFKFDNEASKGFYFKKPSKFYLYYYGVPSFLTETRINTNFREFGREPGDNFYPEVGDLGWWTQEKNVPIRTPNYFKYDPQFSNQSNSFNYRTLPVEFSRRSQAIVDSSTNGVILSLQDTDENGQRNPWLKFKPLDFYEFESKYGKLKELKGIENEAVLARFKDTSIIYNKVNSTVDDGSSVSTFLGGKFVFQRRTTSFINSELGYGGSEHKESLSCEFGHFYVDNERGQIIQIPPGGGQMVEISNINSFGKSTNMKDWFKRNLPLRLPKSNIPGIEKYSSDNAFSFGGTTLGYDSLHKRILITKKDYVPISECVSYDNEVGFYTTCGGGEIITCPPGFEYDSETGKCKKTETYQTCVNGEYIPSIGVCREKVYKKTHIIYIMENKSDMNHPVNIGVKNHFSLMKNHPLFEHTIYTVVKYTNEVVRTLTMEPHYNTDIIENAIMTPIQQTTPQDDPNSYDIIRTTCYLQELYELQDDRYFSRVVYSASSELLRNRQVYCFPTQPYHFMAQRIHSVNTFTGTLQEYTYIRTGGDADNEFGTIGSFNIFASNSINGIGGKSIYDYNNININDISFYYDVIDTPVCQDCRVIEDIECVCPEGSSLNNVTGNCELDGCVNRLSFIIDGTDLGVNRSLAYIYKVIDVIQNEYPNNNFTWTLRATSVEGVYIPESYNGEEFKQQVFDMITMSFNQINNNFGEVLCQTVEGLTNPIGSVPENAYILTFLNSIPEPNEEGECSTTSNDFLKFIDTISFFKNNGGNVYLQYLELQGEGYQEFENSFINIDNPYPSSGNGMNGLSYVRRHVQGDEELETVFSLLGGYPECNEGGIVEKQCTGEVFCECTEYEEPIITVGEAIDIDDPNYFKEISWTIAYNPQMGYFSSFMDYLPNFYVNHDRFFETGRRGLWAHNVTNKSFGVFYGDKHNFEIETISKGTLGSYMGSVELVTEARRFLNEQDFYTNENLTFNKSLIYNRKECSGELKLDLVKGSIAKYPITESIVSQRIPITSRENTFIYNYFFDRVERGVNKPFIINDENQIKISTDNISFKQKGQLARLNGDYFQNRLTYNTDSRFCLVMKLSINLTNLDNL